MADLQLASLIVIIIAVCEAIKRMGVSTRYIPIIAIVLGIAGAFYFDGVSWITTGAGILTALISQGLFSGFKKTVLNK